MEDKPATFLKPAFFPEDYLQTISRIKRKDADVTIEFIPLEGTKSIRKGIIPLVAKVGTGKSIVGLYSETTLSLKCSG